MLKFRKSGGVGEQAVPGREGTTRGRVPPRLPLSGAYIYPVGPRKELKFGYRL